MHSQTTAVKLTLAALAISVMFLATGASGADIKGQVLGSGAPIAQSTVTLWSASSDAPKQLAQTKTDSDGNFSVHGTAAQDASLYLVASGGIPAGNKAGGNNPATALLAVVGSKPPSRVVINEFTTIASVVTHAQFIDNTTIKGSPLQLRIAANNVPNFVDLETGAWGPVILDGLNSAQTPTMANFGTLADVMAGCITRVRADACSQFFAAATPPSGGPPPDTLLATEAVAFFPWHNPDKIFALLDEFYPLPKPGTPGKLMRDAPYLPYLTFAPSAFVFPLKFSGGGVSGGGKLMIDSEGNAWVADNFTVGAQNQDASWTGGLSKFAPNGKPLSPSPLGFRGGGIAGPGFGLTLDAQDNAWATSFTGQNITKFDKNGKALSPAGRLELQPPDQPDAGHHRNPEWGYLDPRSDQRPGGEASAGRPIEGRVLLPEQDGRSAEEPVSPGRAFRAGHRSTGSHLDYQRRHRPCGSFPRFRSQQI